MQDTTLPFLFPHPREIIRRSGTLSLPEHSVIRFPADCRWAPLNKAADKALQQASGGHLRIIYGGDSGDAEVALDAQDIPAEGYQLEISDASGILHKRQDAASTCTGIRIRAADPAGAFYAVLTLAQLLRACGPMLPCLTCTDSPDLPVRGFMLDISRCKVPAMDALFPLIEQLASLRINQLQLYTEHTFAFPGHEIVWGDASPVTPAEIRQLDAFCAAHAIELVPNQQSFGHMERWLKHAPYRQLAECPDGFFHELTGGHRPAGTLKPDRASLDFLARLYDDLLPCFSSMQFNIGGDEPWELGRGWSKPLCETQGRHAVYREHLKGIQKLVAQHGRTMQFWADILLEDPAHADDAPTDAIPVIWGYDAGHPFQEQCATLEKLKRAYLTAPGTSAWQTFHGRLDNALANVNEAVRAANAHHARGVLITSWGDNGNHQPWWTFYPALAAGAAQAWGLAANTGANLVQAVSAIFLDGDTPSAQRLLDLGHMDLIFTKQIRNKSLLWELLFAAEDKLAALLPHVTEHELAAAGHLLDAADAVKPMPGNAAAALADEECRAALALSRLAIARARLVRDGASREEFSVEARRATSVYEAAWLLRARRGGLAESARLLAAHF
ncbi:MAG: family 20 glycosylhydrolase [Puniceicoccales bacterium]|jgi:hypothetical protein|nr:family 20 glycosylhydrolase [Puniceicoccales bacterium]